mmetsp:Transcript_62978/g.74490  ORF Transcript_62978/g.74490 Transcript_62978/m.74490 type:complete len:118 (-) Transcript_62978:369-722(-)
MRDSQPDSSSTCDNRPYNTCISDLDTNLVPCITDQPSNIGTTNTLFDDDHGLIRKTEQETMIGRDGRRMANNHHNQNMGAQQSCSSTNIDDAAFHLCPRPPINTLILIHTYMMKARH